MKRRTLRTMPVATAPVRVCDAGGWTDTWFAGTGLVCNLAVRPGVRVEVTPGEGIDPPTPLVLAAVAEAGVDGVQVRVTSSVPPGSSLGTSSAVTVAVLAALGVPRRELATRAHRVETERLGLQSGVQDQAAAAYGGASWLEVEYPTAQRAALAVPDDAWRELDHRLVTIFLGEHRSSAVHDQVIADVATDPVALDDLRSCAHAAAVALSAGDLVAYGAALIRNTDAQRALHAALVSDDAASVIESARAAGALGWKVNGAGGDGGTVSILMGDDPLALDVGEVLDLRLSRQGVRVTR
jgi:D-glycero-alpha-D-manno-heptose-7-phosphate kinase